MQPRLAAIVTGPITYVDHVGVLAYLLDMPLFITELDVYEKTRELYPQIQAKYCSLEDLDAEFLSTHFDAIFESGKFFAQQMGPMVEWLYKKRMRFVYCPYGHSDKGWSAKSYPKQDLSFVYGPHMLEILTHSGAIKQINETLETGNYRLHFYRAFQDLYDTQTRLHLKALDPAKPVVLYAPSWDDGENPTSFFSKTKQLIYELKDDYNLIIKLHPFLERFHPAKTHNMIERYIYEPRAQFITNFPCIYPLLQQADLYIGDYSSIGYDYLSFDKPLYFFIREAAPKFALHNTGLIIPEDTNIAAFIGQTLKENKQKYSEKRRALYKYVFGEEKDISCLKGETLDLILKNPMRSVCTTPHKDKKPSIKPLPFWAQSQS